MDPFELTKDPDGGGITVRVKHDFVVLTREEERRVTERVAGLMDENAKLRELVRIMHSELVSCEDNGYVCGGHKFDKRVSELGIEVADE